jgi:hypothetical protein
LNVRKEHTYTERATAVRNFNDPNFGADAFVTSLQLGAFGLNFHGACHHGIILEYPHNILTLNHALGRLWRMGQKHEVYWDIFYPDYSFDAWADTHLTLKYANILAAESQIHEDITGEYRVICAFELIRMYLGQDCNRYPRT